jgi:ATP-dependent 26S proteasome regulatory subunit
MRELTIKEHSAASTGFGGFQTQIELIKEVIQLKLVNKGTSQVKIRGILLHGPSGIGKTLAIETVLGPMASLHRLVITP